MSDLSILVRLLAFPNVDDINDLVVLFQIVGDFKFGSLKSYILNLADLIQSLVLIIPGL